MWHGPFIEAKSRKLPCFILGGGTNLLINDAGFYGLVLRINIGGVAAKGTAYGGRRRVDGKTHGICSEKIARGA